MSDESIARRMFDGSETLTDEVVDPHMIHRYSVVTSSGTVLVENVYHSEAIAMRNLWRSMFGGVSSIIETKTLTADGKELFSGEISQGTSHVPSHVSSHVSPNTIVIAGSDADVAAGKNLSAHVLADALAAWNLDLHPVVRFMLASMVPSVAKEWYGINSRILAARGATVIVRDAKNNAPTPTSNVVTVAKVKRGKIGNVVERRYSALMTALDEDILADRGFHVVDRYTLRVLYTGTKNSCLAFVKAQSSTDLAKKDRLSLDTVAVVQYRSASVETWPIVGDVCGYESVSTKRVELARDFIATDNVGGWRVVGPRESVLKSITRRIKSQKIIDAKARLTVSRVWA